MEVTSDAVHTRNTRELAARELNPRPLNHESNTLTTTPPSQEGRAFMAGVAVK